MPVDVGENPKGSLAVVAGKVHMFGPEDAKLHRERRISHFATCPNASEHRR